MTSWWHHRGELRHVDHKFVELVANWRMAPALRARGGGVEPGERRFGTIWSPEHGRRPWPRRQAAVHGEATVQRGKEREEKARRTMGLTRNLGEGSAIAGSNRGSHGGMERQWNHCVQQGRRRFCENPLALFSFFCFIFILKTSPFWNLFEAPKHFQKLWNYSGRLIIR